MLRRQVRRIGRDAATARTLIGIGPMPTERPSLWSATSANPDWRSASTPARWISDRRQFRIAGHWDRPAAAVPRLRPELLVSFERQECRQDVFLVPARVASRCPRIEIGGRSADREARQPRGSAKQPTAAQPRRGARPCPVRPRSPSRPASPTESRRARRPRPARRRPRPGARTRMSAPPDAGRARTRPPRRRR